MRYVTIALYSVYLSSRSLSKTWIGRPPIEIVIHPHFVGFEVTGDGLLFSFCFDQHVRRYDFLPFFWAIVNLSLKFPGFKLQAQVNQVLLVNSLRCSLSILHYADLNFWVISRVIMLHLFCFASTTSIGYRAQLQDQINQVLLVHASCCTLSISNYADLTF